MSSRDPWEILGLARDAGPEEIRARYLELVRVHPPESEGSLFSRIREAYETLLDPDRKVWAVFFESEPLESPAELVPLLLRRERMPVGADAWIEALRGLDKWVRDRG